MVGKGTNGQAVGVGCVINQGVFGWKAGAGRQCVVGVVVVCVRAKPSQASTRRKRRKKYRTHLHMALGINNEAGVLGLQTTNVSANCPCLQAPVHPAMPTKHNEGNQTKAQCTV